MNATIPPEKSLEDLQKDKLVSEIKLLEARLKSDFPATIKKRKADIVADFIKKWAAVILATATVISAILAIFFPLSSYLTEKKKALEYELNENMIEFVNDLNNDSLADRGVMMLSYYEANSIPILLFHLENCENDQKDFKNRIIVTLTKIYINNKKTDLVGKVMTNIDIIFDQIKFENEDGELAINPRKQRAIHNYLDLLILTDVRRHDEKQVNTRLKKLKDEICADAFLKEKIQDIFFKFCVVLNETPDCK